jgi:CheY-like chemotaxis protein
LPSQLRLNVPILIIPFAKVLGACVQKLGYPHVFAVNGEVAVEAFKAREKGFDIVFMDLSMPVLDGFEATKRLREIEAHISWPPAKIVALSTYGTDESRSKAIECRCDLFLMKPASPRKIRETVQLLLKSG